MTILSSDNKFMLTRVKKRKKMKGKKWIHMESIKDLMLITMNGAFDSQLKRIRDFFQRKCK